jgi:hypothetical protein
MGKCESTWVVRTREPDVSARTNKRHHHHLMLHLVEREGVTVVNVGKKLAGGFREVEAHESDEGIDVLECHGLHVTELRSRRVDRSNVGSSRGSGVILETEARLEATGKELVRDRGTSDGAQKENFRPHRSATVRRVNLDFRKHFVEG